VIDEEDWDSDEIYLYDRLGKATTSEVEMFVEKVAVRVAEGWEEGRARRETLKELVEARKR
jgi:hypothetical protein